MFYSCSSKDKIPSDILSINDMKFIVWDLMKAGELAVHDTINNKTASLKNISLQMFQGVFVLHHVDRQKFYSSYDFYSQNPQWNSILLDSVNAVAGRERNALYSYPKPAISYPKNVIHNKAFQDAQRKMMMNKIKRKMPKIDSNFRKLHPV